jgi:hypothetical protein
MKKEEIEEASEKYAKGKSSSSVFQEENKRDFIAGAKWQAERMYSEEEVLLAQQAILSNIRYALGDDNYIIEYLKQSKK